MIRVRREDGVAILTVMLATMLISILGAALFVVARTSLERSVFTTDSTRALDAAESGLETAAAVITAVKEMNGTSPFDDPGGRYKLEWVDSFSGIPWYTVTSTGYYPSSSAPVEKRRVRRVQAEVFSLNPWDFMYAGGMSGATVNGNVEVHGPFYVNDNLLLSGSSGVFGGPLILTDTSAPGDGDLILDSNGANIGTNPDHVGLFIDGVVDQKKTPNGYYADPVYSWAPKLEFPDLTEPQLAYYRFDNASSPSPWLADAERPTAAWDADTSTNYNTALTFSKSSKPVGTGPSKDARLTGSGVSWTWSGTGDKELTIVFDPGDIYPILFVDGDLTFKGGGGNDGLTTIRYQGRGTIVASGSIAITGDLVPVGSTMPSNGDPATLTGFPDTNRLGLITRNNVNFEASTSEWLAAAVYAGGKASFSMQGNLRGGVVTRLLDLGSQVPKLWAEPGFSTKLPPRMPGADDHINSIIGWSELTPTP